MAIGTDDQRLPMHLFYRVCYVVFFKVAKKCGIALKEEKEYHPEILVMLEISDSYHFLSAW